MFKPTEFGMYEWEELTLETIDGFSVRAYVIRGRPENGKAEGVRRRKSDVLGVGAAGSLGTDVAEWSGTTLVVFHANAG